MKKFETIILMVLVAFMGLAVQSCNNDDDVDFYTMRIDITDRGNLPDEFFKAYEARFSSSQRVNYASLSDAKAYLKRSLQDNKSSMEEALVKDKNTYNFTLSYLLINNSGEQVYKISYKIEGTKVTIVE